MYIDVKDLLFTCKGYYFEHKCWTFLLYHSTWRVRESTDQSVVGLQSIIRRKENTYSIWPAYLTRHVFNRNWETTRIYMIMIKPYTPKDALVNLCVCSKHPKNVFVYSTGSSLETTSILYEQTRRHRRCTHSWSRLLLITRRKNHTKKPGVSQPIR